MNLQDWAGRLTYRTISKNVGLLIISALLFTISYTPSPFSFFIYVAFIPFLKLLEDKTTGEVFRYGYILGFLFNIITFNWLIHFKFSSYILLVILNPIQFALFAVLYSILRTKRKRIGLIIFPFLWTTLEYLREWGDLALNWINIGYTQANFLALIQFAEFTGLNGITFWICVINLVIYLWLSEKWPQVNHLFFIIILLFLFLPPLFYGSFKLNEKNTSTGVYATYIQPNIDSKQKWDKTFLLKNLDVLLDFSKKTSFNKGEILIWPETALPFSLQEMKPEIHKLKLFVKQNNLNLLSGILYDSSMEGIKSRFNSTILISFDRDSIQVYRKIKLVPLEEGLPFDNLFKNVLPRKILSSFYEYGTEKTVFKLACQLYNLKFENDKWKVISKYKEKETIKLSSVICLESSFPGFIREFVNDGAELLAVITNDEWFGYSPQPIQHLQTSRFRAIENRISVIHCSNAGVSAFIDPYGRIYNKMDLYEKGSAAQIIPLKLKQTFFTAYGDWAGILCSIISVLAFAVIFINRGFTLKTS